MFSLGNVTKLWSEQTREGTYLVRIYIIEQCLLECEQQMLFISINNCKNNLLTLSYDDVEF